MTISSPVAISPTAPFRLGWPGIQTAPVTRDDWDRAEPGVRFGYGARSQYADHTDWNDKLETRMRGDWDGLKTGRAWDDVKSSVRHGWESAKCKV